MSSDNSFRMECPKCASTNVDLEEDQRAYLGGGRHQVQLHCYTCGHIIYGEKRIQAECDKQYAAWERAAKDGGAAENAPAESAPAPARPPAPAPAPATRARPPADDPSDEDEDSDASEDASDAPAATPAPASAPADAGKAKPARAKAPAKAPAPADDDDDDDDDQSDVAPGRATGTIDPETGLEIVVPSFDAPLDKKGRPLLACTWPPCARYARPNSKYCSRNCSNKNARARYARRKDG